MEGRAGEIRRRSNKVHARTVAQAVCSANFHCLPCLSRPVRSVLSGLVPDGRTPYDGVVLAFDPAAILWYQTIILYQERLLDTAAGGLGGWTLRDGTIVPINITWFSVGTVASATASIAYQDERDPVSWGTSHTGCCPCWVQSGDAHARLSLFSSCSVLANGLYHYSLRTACKRNWSADTGRNRQVMGFWLM